jgi:hypothetical protein
MNAHRRVYADPEAIRQLVRALRRLREVLVSQSAQLRAALDSDAPGLDAIPAVAAGIGQLVDAGTRPVVAIDSLIARGERLATHLDEYLGADRVAGGGPPGSGEVVRGPLGARSVEDDRGDVTEDPLASLFADDVTEDPLASLFADDPLVASGAGAGGPSLHPPPLPVPTMEELTLLHSAGGRFYPVDLRGVPSEQLTSEQRVAQKVASLFETAIKGKDGRTAHFEVTLVRALAMALGDGIFIQGRAVLDGEHLPCSHFVYSFLPGKDGDWTAQPVELEIDPEVQGNGYGSRFSRHPENALRRMGIRRVIFEANGSTGPAIWAMDPDVQWQEERPPAREGEVCSGLEEYIQRHSHAAERARECALAQEMLARLRQPSGEPIPSPRDVALLGYVDGARDWIGKRIMARQWYGQRTLL